jgi:iron complex transport system substrate-binding protein
MYRKFPRLLVCLLALAAFVPAMLSAQAAGTWPRTVTDDLGVSIKLAQKPQKIVSVTTPTDEILLALVAKSRIAAVTAFSEDPTISNVVSQVIDIPTKLAQMNAEVIIAMKPDIVFVADWSDAAGVKQLRNAGVPVYQFRSPITVKEIEAKITAVGAVVGEEETAKKLVLWMETRLAAVAAKVNAIAPDKRLTVMDYTTWGTSMGAGSSWDEIVRLAGLKSAVASLKADQYGSVSVSREMLLQLDPDILMLPSWVYGDVKGSDAFYNGVVGDPALKTLKAVKLGRVHRMPEALKTSTSQYIVLAVEDLAKYAYPELFK